MLSILFVVKILCRKLLKKNYYSTSSFDVKPFIPVAICLFVLHFIEVGRVCDMTCYLVVTICFSLTQLDNLGQLCTRIPIHELLSYFPKFPINIYYFHRLTWPIELNARLQFWQIRTPDVELWSSQTNYVKKTKKNYPCRNLACRTVVLKKIGQGTVERRTSTVYD